MLVLPAPPATRLAALIPFFLGCFFIGDFEPSEEELGSDILAVWGAIPNVGGLFEVSGELFPVHTLVFYTPLHST